MKNLFVFSLSMLAFLCFSCNRNQGGEDPCCGGGPAGSISTNWDDIKTEFVDGVFKIDCKITSDEKGEAFILLAFRHPEYCCGGFVPISGYGNDLKVDGYQIRSYHQIPLLQLRMYGELLDTPILEFPVFVKKIKVPKGSVHEKIKVRLPDGLTDCWGQIFLFRNSKAIEESMKTKVSPEAYWEKAYKGTINGKKYEYPRDPEHFDHYYKLFPDSSMFSYLITSMTDLGFDYCDNIGRGKSGECIFDKVGFCTGWITTFSRDDDAQIFFNIYPTHLFRVMNNIPYKE